MDIIVTQEQGRVPVTVLRLKGDLNVNSYQQLEAEARRAFEGGARNLTVDLTEVPFVSSAGIRALNAIFNLLRTSAPEESDEAMRVGLRAGTFKSPHLKLVSPAPSVKEVLSMAGVDMFIEIHSNLKSALASY